MTAPVGVQTGDAARSLGVGEVREWAKTTRSPRTRREIQARVRELGIADEEPRAVLVVEALDEVRDAADDDTRVHWVRYFRGDSPSTRRGVVDAGLWNNEMTQELADVATRLREGGNRSVVVRGVMRLPTWFAAGRALSDVAGFDVAAMDRGELWQPGPGAAPPELVVQIDEHAAGPADHVALVVQISAEGVDDVREALGDSVGRIVAVTLAGGPDRRLFASGADAFAAAVVVRDWVRRNLQGLSIHMVLVASGPYALFLGHLWDRVPATTIYEDLAPGYEAAFEFRNS